MIKATFKALQKKWNSYKYRFVPWIAVNLGKNERTLRQVMDRTQDKLVSDEEISASLRTFFRALFKSSLQRQQEVLSVLPDSSRSTYQAFPYTIERQKSLDGHHDPSKVMLETMGFSIHRAPSSLQSAGTGVFISIGTVPQGATVAMYPGTVYYAHEPIFFQSIHNPFIFRCIDGVLVDGNDRGLSKVVFRPSIAQLPRSDNIRLKVETYLAPGFLPAMTLPFIFHSKKTVFVHKDGNKKAANVCYQEFDVPAEFPLELRQFLPNVNYRHEIQRPLRCVVLVALREIHQGEELFSNYYTIVH